MLRAHPATDDTRYESPRPYYHVRVIERQKGWKVWQ
ncbi:MAG: DUF5086 domain-containing protein, partial [Brucella intermedia]